MPLSLPGTLSSLSRLAPVAVILLSHVVMMKAKEPLAERTENLPDLIATALRGGEKRIVIPPGRYRVLPHDRVHLKLSQLKDVEIIADGVEMVCLETTRAITIEDCENLTIRGLAIDYDPLPYTQGRITSISDDRSTLRAKLLGGFPSTGLKKGSVEIFDPGTRELRGRQTYFQTRITAQENDEVTMVKEDRGDAGEQIGDIAVFPVEYAPGGRLPHAIYSKNCRRLTLENITVFASPNFAFLEDQCDESRYLGCTVDRRTAEGGDLVSRELPRLRSSNADAFHAKNASHGPAFERCTARFMGDDAIAINGDFHFISASKGNTLRVLAKGDLTIRTGDTVQVFGYAGTRLPDAKVLSITPDGLIQPEERQFLLVQKMDENTRTNMIKNAYSITLDRPIDVLRGSLICSADRLGNGFSITNCRVGANRSRGIIVKAGHGIISNNTVEGSVMESILICPEYWWMEAGLADDLIIENNRILKGGQMGIVIKALGGNGNIAPASAFRNLTIRNNTIQGGAAPGILATSVSGLVLQDNHVLPDVRVTLEPWKQEPWAAGGIRPIITWQCEKVRGNNIP